jgi:mannose-6-phosphate isomerase-like protein (cupin superfamily)
MSHTADVAQFHDTLAGGTGRTEKEVAHVLPGGGARSLWVMGVLVTLKVPGHKTGGAYALFEVATQSGEGPPPHVHHREDEAFYVLEGMYEFLVGGEALRVEAGSLLYVPKGTLHTHSNVGEGAGRMLVTQTPGGLYERFFEEVGQEMVSKASMAFSEEGSPEAARVAESAARYGIEIAFLGGRVRLGHPARPIQDSDS